MNRLGMLVEISRLSEPAMMIALNTAKAPLLLSNASPLSLCNSTTSTASIPDHILRWVLYIFYYFFSSKIIDFISYFEILDSAFDIGKSRRRHAVIWGCFKNYGWNMFYLENVVIRFFLCCVNLTNSLWKFMSLLFASSLQYFQFN